MGSEPEGGDPGGVVTSPRAPALGPSGVRLPAAQGLLSRGDVSGHLDDQVVHGVEHLLAPETGDEIDSHGRPVEVQVIAPERVGLDPPLGARELRVGPDRHRGGKRLPRHHEPPGVDPVRRDRCAIGDLDVGGGVAQLAAALIAADVPIRGEAGVGYVLDRSFHLPPLMFATDELEAIALGAQWVIANADPALARAAQDVIAKVAAVVPAPLRPLLTDPVVGTPPARDRTTADVDADDAAGEPVNGGAKLIALIVAQAGDILTVSEFGYGKRTAIDQFPLRGRGGQGVIAQALSDKTGRLLGALDIHDRHELMLISDAGHLIRVRASDIKQLGRNTQGVRVARPSEGDRLVGLDRIEPEVEADVDADADGAGDLPPVAP